MLASLIFSNKLGTVQDNKLLTLGDYQIHWLTKSTLCKKYWKGPLLVDDDNFVVEMFKGIVEFLLISRLGLG